MAKKIKKIRMAKEAATRTGDLRVKPEDDTSFLSLPCY